MMDSVAKLGVSNGVHIRCMTKSQPGFLMVRHFFSTNVSVGSIAQVNFLGRSQAFDSCYLGSYLCQELWQSGIC